MKKWGKAYGIKFVCFFALPFVFVLNIFSLVIFYSHESRKSTWFAWTFHITYIVYRIVLCVYIEKFSCYTNIHMRKKLAGLGCWLVGSCKAGKGSSWYFDILVGYFSVLFLFTCSLQAYASWNVLVYIFS